MHDGIDYENTVYVEDSNFAVLQDSPSVPNLLSTVQHRGLVLGPLSYHHHAIHLNAVEHLPHHIYCSLLTKSTSLRMAILKAPE